VIWEEYASAWSALHGGFDPEKASFLVRGWVRLAWRGGNALARLRVGPSAVTTLGLLLCVLVPVVALVSPLAAGLVVLLASFADGLDGAVAVVSGRATRIGYVYDSVADRLGEAAWLVALWVAGAPAWLAVAAGGVSWLHEYVRARAASAGMPEIGVGTVAERTTRVSVAVSGLVVGGVAALVHDSWGAVVMTAAAAAWLALALIGLAQLVTAVRRALSA
jgi:CDP-diacylglycerol--glycerol-3-phosphate 3-phosphatidyltransferase